MRRATSVQLNDSAGYFFDAAERLTTPGYVPTDQDLLRARVKSTGITETTFDVRNLTFRVLDPGGQRSERKKWVHCFEAVDVLLFVIAVSEFPQRLREDEGTVSSPPPAHHLATYVR
jgi:guanine nucleotide-binding protein G(i) subunit alpha